MDAQRITLGAEEELQVVDQTTGALAHHDFSASQDVARPVRGALARELSTCTIEAKTDICRTPSEVFEQLRSLRAAASARARSQGHAIVAAGLHPFSNWRQQQFHADPAQFEHYAAVLQEYQDLARGAMSFGTHVHVGIPQRELRIPVMNRLRELLPLLVAVTVNSPFYLGRDTGLQSWRPSLFGRLPRTGVPELWKDEDEYFRHVNRLRAAGFIDPQGSVWGDIRLHHRYGTLEVRICDVHHRLERTWLVAAMLQAEAATLVAELSASAHHEPLPKLLIEEGIWQVRRHGLQARVFEPVSLSAISLEDAFSDWLARVAPAARELGIALRLEQAVARCLAEPTGAQEQRAWAAGGLQQLVMRLRAETLS